MDASQYFHAGHLLPMYFELIAYLFGGGTMLCCLSLDLDFW
jgi:hypothetical protein